MIKRNRKSFEHTEPSELFLWCCLSGQCVSILWSFVLFIPKLDLFSLRSGVSHIRAVFSTHASSPLKSRGDAAECAGNGGNWQICGEMDCLGVMNPSVCRSQEHPSLQNIYPPSQTRVRSQNCCLGLREEKSFLFNINKLLVIG